LCTLYILKGIYSGFSIFLLIETVFTEEFIEKRIKIRQISNHYANLNSKW